MFLFEIKEKIENLQYYTHHIKERNDKENKEMKFAILDLKESIDLLKLNSCCLSDVKVIFEELAKREIKEINDNINHEYSFNPSGVLTLCYKDAKSEDGTRYHIFYLSRRRDDIEVYSDLQLMKKYEFSEENPIKSEVVRNAFVLYLATKILKDKLPLIKNLEGTLTTVSYITSEAEKNSLLEKIGK